MVGVGVLHQGPELGEEGRHVAGVASVHTYRSRGLLHAAACLVGAGGGGGAAGTVGVGGGGGGVVSVVTGVLADGWMAGCGWW